MDIMKFVLLTVGVGVVALMIGIMGPIVASNLLPTATGTGVTAVLSNASTVNTITQLAFLFVPISLILYMVKKAMGKSE